MQHVALLPVKFTRWATCGRSEVTRIFILSIMVAKMVTAFSNAVMCLLYELNLCPLIITSNVFITFNKTRCLNAIQIHKQRLCFYKPPSTRQEHGINNFWVEFIDLQESLIMACLQQISQQVPRICTSAYHCDVSQVYQATSSIMLPSVFIIHDDTVQSQLSGPQEER